MKPMFDENKICSCGKYHKTFIPECIIEKNAVAKIADYAKMFNAKKAFIVADINTYPVAGDKVTMLLSESGISVSKYIFNSPHLEPDEIAAGSLALHYNPDCDIIIAIGSGVINDLSKILAHQTKNPYIIVATAPSMDGYASPLSSMSRDGLKVSIPSKCAEVIIGDIDILKTAPVHMIKSGLGDMLAKYISICEWRLSNLITGEYYCEEIADMVRNALKKCADAADGILKLDDTAIKNVFEGLVLSGLAMSYASLSRPASGAEHSFSHILDMRSLEFNTPADLHGIQCAVASMLCVRIYNSLKNTTPDKDKALKHTKAFDVSAWEGVLKNLLGKSAEPILELDKKEDKYNIKNHEKRLNIIISDWEKIVKIIDKEIPTESEFEQILDSIGSPKEIEEIGIESDLIPTIFKASKDIRDKYILPKLLWDIGILDEI